MSVVTRTAAALVLMAGAPLAQGGTIDVAIESAKAARSEGRLEDASLILNEALARADELEADAAKVARRRIRTMLQQVDPLEKARRKALKAAAKGFVSVAQAYSRAKWHGTAIDMLEDHARDLDPATADRVLGTVRRAAGTLGTNQIDRYFARAKVYRRTQGEVWRVEEGMVTSPAIDRTTLFVSPLELRGDFELTVEVKLGQPVSKAAVLVGFEELAEDARYLVMEAGNFPKGETSVGIFDWPGHKASLTKFMENLGETGGTLPNDRRFDWLELVVRVRGDRVRVGIAGLPEIERLVKSSTRGKIGFFVSGNKKSTERVSFRNLRIRQ